MKKYFTFSRDVQTFFFYFFNIGKECGHLSTADLSLFNNCIILSGLRLKADHIWKEIY